MTEIIRQIELKTFLESDKYGRRQAVLNGIVYSQTRDGAIYRRESRDGEDMRVGFLPVTKVDHDSYRQHINFIEFIADKEYGMARGKAIQLGLLPDRPETVQERALRRKAWYEKSRDFREKLSKGDDL